jgi:putative ABC transport system permease protein
VLRLGLTILFGDLAKFLGILLGLVLTAFLITQQASIFWGLMSRTFGAISDCAYPDVWVMNDKVQFIDDIKPLATNDLQRVRGVPGVAWAVPLYKGLIKARLADGTFQTCNVLGLDDASLVGGPPEMLSGSLGDLRQSDGVIVDINGANGKLAKPAPTPDGKRLPLVIGDTLELNDRRAVVVGFCRSSRTFQSNPVIYTTYSRATSFAPSERRLMSFVLVKLEPGSSADSVCAEINRRTGLLALTRDGFEHKTLMYFMKYTGIPINFGIAVVLAFIVGMAIAGLMFFSFTSDNLRHYAAFKAMGCTTGRLTVMVMLQAVVVGLLGWGIGVGAAAGFGLATGNSELAFRMTWAILGLSGLAVTVICLLAAAIAMIRVALVQPATVFR